MVRLKEKQRVPRRDQQPDGAVSLQDGALQSRNGGGGGRRTSRGYSCSNRRGSFYALCHITLRMSPMSATTCTVSGQWALE